MPGRLAGVDVRRLELRVAGPGMSRGARVGLDAAAVDDATAEHHDRGRAGAGRASTPPHSVDFVAQAAR